MSSFVEQYPILERQAADNDNMGCAIAFDGRLDNRGELSGADAVLSDEALVLKAYARWGEACAKHLIGDFAFAIWDRRNQRLFCARDAMGVQPFYYHWNGRRLTCASTLQALLGAADVPRRPNDSMIADFLLFGEFHDAQATFFEDIRQLPPAHTLTLENGALRLTHYWDPAQTPEAAGSLEDHMARFRELFCEAVCCRMPPKDPTGVWLSGGIDSSLVAAAAETVRQKQSGTPALHAFTLYYEDVYQEEWDAIERIQARYKTPLHKIMLDAADGPMPLFELFVSRSAIPYFHGLPLHPKMFQAARAESCGVLLTGHGGDELIGMSEEGQLSDLLQSGRWLRLARDIQALARSTNGPPRDLAVQLLLDQLSPRLRQKAKWLLRRRSPDWIEPDFERRLALAKRLEPQAAASSVGGRARQLSVWALTRPSMTWSLNQQHETAAQFGIKCSYPFLDRRLIECFLSVPQAIKLKTGYRKLFSQQALAPMMPGPLRTRFYGAPVAPEQHRDPLMLTKEAEMLAQAIGVSKLAAVYRYVRYDSVLTLLDSLRKGNISTRTPLWKFASLSGWLSQPMNQLFPA